MKENGKRIIKLDERYYKEFLSIFWKKLITDYIRIYEENIVAKMVSNDAIEILILLNKIGENANVILREIEFLLLSKMEGIDEENEKDEENYRIEQMM
ncbi:hypothetical protein C1645_819899 [Glomus cerebriforme]|uniref:Uncharacterized protein n=1 Tax=Glomus cerebriforme TaxID=658196 RepID=A0A397TDN1_9GLOM|nr:hypothetical protein C1645_819899 [Glomus cerebriforme]